MLIQIVAPHFVAGYDTEDGIVAPIISYMKGWNIDKIKEYCNRKGWECQIIRR